MTILISLAFLGMITFFGSSETNFLTLGLSRAREVSLSLSDRSEVETVSLARSLPLTWTTTSTASDKRHFSSQVGHSSFASKFSSISEARCGANGLRSLARTTRSSWDAPVL